MFTSLRQDFPSSFVHFYAIDSLVKKRKIEGSVTASTEHRVNFNVAVDTLTTLRRRGNAAEEIFHRLPINTRLRSESFSQMQAALRRGLDYGILKKTHGHYFLNTNAEPHLASSLVPTEQDGRRRRRGRGRRRRGRARRGRSRGRRRGRRGRRRGRRSRRRRSRRRRGRGAMKTRRIACTRCRCTTRSRNVNVLKDTPMEQQDLENMCMCEKESNVENQSRRSRSRDRSLSRSRSSANSDRDDAIDDRRPIHDQD